MVLIRIMGAAVLLTGMIQSASAPRLAGFRPPITSRGWRHQTGRGPAGNTRMSFLLQSSGVTTSPVMNPMLMPFMCARQPIPSQII